MKEETYQFKFLAKGLKCSLVTTVAMDDVVIYQEAINVGEAEDKLRDFFSKQYLKADRFILKEISKP